MPLGLGHRTTLPNMNRNQNLRLSARSARRAKNFELEFRHRTWFELEIVRLAHRYDLPRGTVGRLSDGQISSILCDRAPTDRRRARQQRYWEKGIVWRDIYEAEPISYSLF